MPLIMMPVIASVLPASRWCNLFLYFMNLPSGGSFTAFMNTVRSSFHLLPWGSKDEKTSSWLFIGKHINKTHKHKQTHNILHHNTITYI